GTLICRWSAAPIVKWRRSPSAREGCVEDHQWFCLGATERRPCPVAPHVERHKAGGEQVGLDLRAVAELQGLLHIEDIAGLDELVVAVHANDTILVRRFGGNGFAEQ